MTRSMLLGLEGVLPLAATIAAGVAFAFAFAACARETQSAPLHPRARAARGRPRRPADRASAIRRAERDALASTAAQALAELQAAVAAVQLAQLDLALTTIRAPIAGRAGQAMVSRGDFVAAGPVTRFGLVLTPVFYVALRSLPRRRPRAAALPRL
ncbi:MAG: hypothetical protein ACTHU0_03935 [Kofleriaceae bacterium]